MGVVTVLLLAAVLALLLAVLSLLICLCRTAERAVNALKILSKGRETASVAESTEEDARRSRAVEDGIASILQYAAGKVPGVEVEL